MRYQLTIAGVPVGHHLKEHPVWSDGENPWQESGSLIIVLATDAPLLPHQLKRIAKRASLGMARTGSLGGNGSGDIFIAFSTANPGAALQGDKHAVELRALDNDHLNPLFGASVFAAEEAIINSMVAGEDMTGHKGFSVKGLPHEELRGVMKKYNRWSNNMQKVSISP
jgi:D-aminopeptidase